MALLATQGIVRAGITPALTAAAGGGDTFTPGPNMFLEIVNAGGGSINATVVTPGTVRGEPITDRVVAVTNGQRRFIQISPADFYADPTTGLGNLTYSGVASVTVGVFQAQDT